MQKKYLYIPIEIYRRELSGMLILSTVAALKGWVVVIGGKKSIFPLLNLLPEGFVLLKSIVPGEIKTQKYIKSLGHKVVSLDAEGLIFSEGDSAVTLRYSDATINLSEALFFWGKEQFSRVKKIFPAISSIGYISGSPIFDYWRLTKKQVPISKKMRKKVLIATSFPTPNHYINEDMAFKLLADAVGKDINAEVHFENFRHEGEFQKIVLPHFKIFVDSIIKNNPSVDFILRPHTNENPKCWIDIGSNYPNVQMSLSGELTPTLLDCDILIHFNSTTAIEASYYDKDILTYIPKSAVPDYLYERLNKHCLRLSHVSHSIEEGNALLRKILQGTDSISKSLEDIIETALLCDTFACSTNITSALDSLKTPTISRSFPNSYRIFTNPIYLKTKLKQRMLWFVGWVDYLTGLFKGRYRFAKDNYKYGQTKQGKLDLTAIQLTINQVLEEMNIDKKKIQVEKIKNGFLKIERTDAI